MRDLAAIRALAKQPGGVTVGGDAAFSMGGRGVGGAEVEYALCNATEIDERDSYVVITGPTPDGEILKIVAKVTGRIKVQDVLL